MLALFFWLGIAQMPESVNAGINDLLLHATGYCVSVFSAYLMVQKMSKMWILLVGLWLFSFAIEAVQYYLPWRSFSVLDLIANGSGILTGIALVAALQPALDTIISWVRLSVTNAEVVE